MATFTQSQVNAHNARLTVKKSNPVAFDVEVKSEKNLHQQILDECARRGWLPFHGSTAHKTFRTEGEPDFVICCDGGRVLMVECKKKDGKLSPAQMAIHAWASKLGHKVHTIRAFSEFLTLAEL